MSFKQILLQKATLYTYRKNTGTYISNVFHLNRNRNDFNLTELTDNLPKLLTSQQNH